MLKRLMAAFLYALWREVLWNTKIMEYVRLVPGEMFLYALWREVLRNAELAYLMPDTEFVSIRPLA